METKSLIILGSTGSIGTQALDVTRLCGFRVKALTANSNAALLEEQAREFMPDKVALADEKAAAELKIRLADTPIEVLSGREGVLECAGCDAGSVVLNSLVGMSGLEPTLRAIEAGSKLALANKETLVAGGALVKAAAKENGVDILPVDSEHSAIFQSIQGMRDRAELKRVILTASGGPFFGMTRSQLETVTLEQALKHPNWSMGAKITVDSATMMNKGLELIEAVWLFDIEPDNVDILVHRQSVVHSLAEFTDNSVIAQLGVPDMRIPIQYALTYPYRRPSPVRRLDLSEWGSLTFEKPDYETFECIDICRRAIKKGGLYPAVVNSANEQANELFRVGRISFLSIPELVGAVADSASFDARPYTLADVLDADKWAREQILSNVKE